MRQIVKDILETESKTREILDQARRAASEMRLAVEKEASEQVGIAGQQAREIIQTAAEDARRNAERMREETLRQADQRAHDLLDDKKDLVEELVARVCAVVLNTEWEMDDQ